MIFSEFEENLFFFYFKNEANINGKDFFGLGLFIYVQAFSSFDIPARGVYRIYVIYVYVIFRMVALARMFWLSL